MVNVLGHTIRPDAVDYISEVKKINVQSDCTFYFELTLFLRGQKLVLQHDKKEVLEKNKLDIINALVYDKVKDQGLV